MPDRFGNQWGLYIKPKHAVFEKLTATTSLFIKNGIPGRYRGIIEFMNQDPKKNKTVVIEEYYHDSVGHGTPIAFLLTQSGFLVNDTIKFKFSINVSSEEEEKRILKISVDTTKTRC